MFNILLSACRERTPALLAASILSICSWNQSALAQTPTEAPTAPPEAEDVMPTAPGESSAEVPDEGSAAMPESEGAEETAADEAADEAFVTVCTYDPSSGVPNPLGMRAFVTVSEVEGNSVVRYEQFPSPVNATEDAGRAADVASERTLTLYDTPIVEARQLLIDFPTYYAELVGLESAESVGDENGFESINDTLTCQSVSDATVANVPQPSDRTPAAPGPAPDPTAEPEAPTDVTEQAGEASADAATLAALPNGNYRVVSADFPLRVVTDEELLESGGTMFTFRKFGEDVTGIFGYIDSEIGACVAGTLEGNTVTGQAFTNDEPVSLERNVEETDENPVFLGPGGFLQLGEEVAAERYDNSVLNLAGFSRINAGTRIPPESCP